MSVPFVTVRAIPGLAVLAIVVLSLSRGAAGAADFPVTRFNDPSPGPCLPGDCSLREAIQAANAAPGPNTIDLPAGTYDLTRTGSGEDAALTGDLDITDDLTITGAGADTTAIDASPLGDRVFDVLGAATSVDVYGLTITGGGLLNNAGGAFRNAGLLYLHQVVLAGNNADNDYGGGVVSYGHLFMEDTTVSDGFASEGGGITNFGTATLRRVTIADNQASYGAGIQNMTGGSIDVINSTISGNHASQNSGGINNFGEGTVNLFNATISDNAADDGGGGIGEWGDGTFILRNSVVSGNTGDANPECLGEFTDADYNLIAYIDGLDCVPVGPATGSIWGTPADLGPLADNGGPTLTHALLPGSPGINDGNPAGCVDNDFDPLTTDQRGADRYVGGRCDMGAFEFGATPPTPTPTPTPVVTPVPTTLSCIGPPGTVSDGVAELSAVLTSGGDPVPGAEVQWSDEPGLFTVMPESSTTDGTGTASTGYSVPADAGIEGDETVTATFGGDGTYASATCEITFHVVSSHLPTPTPTNECPAPTPTPTPSPTPTPPTPAVDFPITRVALCNDTDAPASDLHLTVNYPDGQAFVDENPQGCPTPSVAYVGTTVDIVWGIACVDPGETTEIGLMSDFGCYDCVVDLVSHTWTFPLQGDTDCDDDVDSVDALWVLKDTAGLPHSAACIERGNIDCDADRDAVDALGILKHVASLPPLSQHEPCADIGTPV